MDLSNQLCLVVPPVPEVLVDLRVRSGRSVLEDLEAQLDPPVLGFQLVPVALQARLDLSALGVLPAP
ncbi:MAG TPA: hypothetical protein VLZ10_02305 [Thermodesulfobacteriota bacterium]|nr:hypothetical protein [Thermodesulfobacteriota bacterium]